MQRASLAGCCLGSLILACVQAGCVSDSATGPPVHIRYVGSSTVAIFLRDAEPVYRRATFDVDTEPESDGGERAILEGTTELAGVARPPRSETLHAGITSTLIGRDAIAVIVNAQNPVEGLSRGALREVFAGRVRNWRELGGPDLPLRTFIVGAESATSRVFREAILGREEYAECEEIRPDIAIIDAVARTPGGVGQISFSFLPAAEGRVRALAVDDETPSVTNFQYPIARPLYLLRREGDPGLDAFVRWVGSDAGQRVVMRHFVGTRVVGSVVGRREEGEATGTLIVQTETYPVDDGGIRYYPHRPYDVLTRHGEVLRHVPNHHGENDETPTRITLPAETYLIRAKTSHGLRPEFFVTIEAGRTTELNVEELVRGKP